MFIYEVVDTTNDELYFPMGLFLSLDEAKAAILNGATDSESPMTEYGGEGDCEQIEIREREIGWSEQGVTKFTLNRQNKYDEEGDANWVVTGNSDNESK